MKPQPFNLDLWLHLGKPDCVWTRSGNRVKELNKHDCSRASYCLSGIVEDTPFHRFLHIWTDCGESFRNTEMFHPLDLMLHLEDKPKTFGIKKK
jgi:hypothetical protein